MSDLSKLSLIKEMLDSAESGIRSAKKLLSEITGVPMVSRALYADKAQSIITDEIDKNARIIEGVFDGQGMIDKQGNTYPVPANYASKSKLIPGDVLKLTITDEGKFIYKQIAPIPRKTVIGPLVFEDGQYKVLANGNGYKVLLASVTYFKGEVGDEVTLVIPAEDDSEWGAIEAILPKFGSEKITVGDFDDDDELGIETPTPKKRGRKKNDEEDTE